MKFALKNIFFLLFPGMQRDMLEVLEGKKNKGALDFA